MNWWRWLHIDNFLLFILMTIMLASFFPCQGKVKIVFQNLTTIAIALLFFLHGVKLSRQAILAGIVKRLNFDYIINMSYSLDFRRKVLAIKKTKA